MKDEVEKYRAIGIILIVAMTFFYFILGLDGMMSVLGIFLLFIAPIYFILGNFSLEEDEKLAYSFFIGVGIFPSLAYWMGLFISFKIAISISFIIMVVMGFLIRGYMGKKHA
ncbi:hypothetical protein HYW19_01950 [Candidatus Woesearchaeota archaeon]|nr:hypothetical protein [Candidatus Woesearchaeota archaeon]